MYIILVSVRRAFFVLSAQLGGFGGGNGGGRCFIQPKIFFLAIIVALGVLSAREAKSIIYESTQEIQTIEVSGNRENDTGNLPQVRTAEAEPEPERIVSKVSSQTYSGLACSCYLWAVHKTGRTDLLGYRLAKNIPVNSDTPTIGGLVVTYEGWAGHIAIIQDIQGDELILDEANYSRCRVTSGRKLNINNSLIKGYIK